MGSTLGRLPRCEFKKIEVEGMAIGIDWVIFLRRLAVKTMEGFLDYSLEECLDLESFVLFWFFIFNRWNMNGLTDAISCSFT